MRGEHHPAVASSPGDIRGALKFTACGDRAADIHHRESIVGRIKHTNAAGVVRGEHHPAVASSPGDIRGALKFTACGDRAADIHHRESIVGRIKHTNAAGVKRGEEHPAVARSSFCGFATPKTPQKRLVAPAWWSSSRGVDRGENLTLHLGGAGACV